MAKPVDTDRLYREGVAAIRAGDQAAGRQRLAQVLKAQPNHADAWYWLSAAVDTDKERVYCLRKALAINPNHEAAAERFAILTGTSPTPEPESAPPPEPESAPAPEPAPPPEPEPAPPAAGPDESWRQGFAEGAEESAAEDDDEDEYEWQPSAGRTWRPATPGKEAWMGTAAAAQEPQPALGGLAKAEPENEREAWRASLYKAQPEPEEEAERKKKRPRRARPDASALEIVDSRPTDYGLLDLFDAWAQALIFRVRGAYQETVRYGGFGYTALTLFVAGILSAVTSVLMFQLVIAPLGGIQGIVARFAVLPEATPEALTLMTQFFSGLGIWIAAFAFVQAAFGRLLYGLAVHVVAGLFGGKGKLGATLSAISLATISRLIVTLIPVMLLVFALILSLPAGLAMGLGGVLYLGWIVYAWVAEVIAIRTAHPQLGVLAAVGVVVAIGIALSLFSCCLSFAASALGAGGAS
jgi:hypothetical protein